MEDEVRPSFEEVAWDEIAACGGTAAEFPQWLRGLRDPGKIADCYFELGTAIFHQGDCYPATVAVVPYLVDAALDPEVVDRLGAMWLIHMASVGHTRRRLDWQEIRDAKDPLYERRAWDMVASEHKRLRVLLDDDDGAVSRLALVILARTGDTDRRTLEAMRSAVGSSEDRQRCNGWLCAASLGVLAAGLEAPWRAAADTDALTRFGMIVAGLRFEAAWVDGAMVDELCLVLAKTQERFGYDQCDFFLPDNEQANVAAAALEYVPERLVARTSAGLLGALAETNSGSDLPLGLYIKLNVGKLRRGVRASELPESSRLALVALLDPLRRWRGPRRLPRGPGCLEIPELERWGLPNNVGDLAAWLGLTSE